MNMISNFLITFYHFVKIKQIGFYVTIKARFFLSLSLH